MRTPPALAHPAGRASWLAALLLALWLPALLATLAAALSGSARTGAWLGAPWLALALIGGGLWRFWRQQTPRELAFDGQGWLLREPGRPGQAVSRVQVALDGQRFLLLRLERAGAPPLWLCLRRGAGSAAAAAWRLLRCALYSPAPVPESAPSPDDSDAALVARAVQGQTRAYELLVIKYQRRIERLIGRMVRDVDLVQDIAQETFINAWRALPQFRGEAQFYTWLYRIAVNTAKRALLGLKRDPLITQAALKGQGDDDENFRPDAEPISDSTPETELAAREIAAAVNEAMQALSPDLRQAITLREIEGLSYEEIAELMACPIGTVRSRIFRAREAISARVKPLLSHQGGKRW